MEIAMRLCIPFEICLSWMSCKFLFLLLQLFLQSGFLKAQQEYVNNHQLDCDDATPSTKGYLCNGVQSSCQSYITFRSNPPYTSPAKIGYLLGTDGEATRIASMNNISSDVATIPADKLVVVPVNCSCFRGFYYQHNATYRIKDETDNYFTLANNTYQGLTTCQALSEQNKYDTYNVYAGLDINVPLRCACPTTNQTAFGAKYMLIYLVTWGDSISQIAQLFNASEQSVLDANELSEDDLIYPFTPILIPVTSEPKMIQSRPYSPPPTRSPPLNVVPISESNSSKKWVYLGVAIGAGLLILVSISAISFWHFRTPSPSHQKSPDTNVPTNNDLLFPYVGIQNSMESLIVYKFDDIQTATGYFSEDNKIKSSIYKGSFRGDHAAVKLMKGDVSNEINLLNKINHSNIIRLSGFCVNEGNTYLVYEYAENGSLREWLNQTSCTLSWKQRVQIAYDIADALNYLHNYITPPFVHKNLNASNVLLDGNFRAKITNFGLARKLANDEQGATQLTRHVVGTHDYIAPEYLGDGLITPKLDVFAYGVVLLELLSGKDAIIKYSNGDEKMLSTLINQVLQGDNVEEKLHGFIDPCIRDELPLHLAISMAQLARSCVAQDPNARPSLLQLFTTLSKIISCSLN